MSLATHATGQTAPGARGDVALRQYLTFLLDDRTYGVPLEEVAEITPNLPLNRIPHLPKGVEGVLDLRGSLLPVVNLRTRLGLAAEGALPANIIILGLDGNRIGILVDRVQSVHSAHPEDHTPASPLLEGLDGAWTKAFLLVDRTIISLLDSRLLVAIGSVRTSHGVIATSSSADKTLDQGLMELIDLAPAKAEVESNRIIPQMEAAIAHTEEEMAKVLDKVESILVSTDQAFQGMIRLKQESKLGRLPGQDAVIAELEKIGQEIQDRVFGLIQMIQYQDIARQKLERVLNHLRGLQMIVGTKFRDTGKHLI